MDEHILPLYREQLLRHEPTLIVLQIGDEGVPPKGTPDPEILRWCEVNGFMIVTSNRKSMPVHLANHLAAGRHIPGILQLNLNAPIGSAIEDLWIAAVASEENEFEDLIIYIPFP